MKRAKRGVHGALPKVFNAPSDMGSESFAPEDAVSWTDREAIANLWAARTNNEIARQYFGQAPQNLIDTLFADGIVSIQDLTLNPNQVREVVEYLQKRPVYGAHVPVFSDGVARDLRDPESRKFPFGSYRLQDAIGAPHLLELAFHPKVLALTESYLGCAPSLYSVHCWWSFPGHSIAGPQVFHRDVDDYRFLALFIFLTDVEGGRFGGEHDFICSTHRQDNLEKYFKNDPNLALEFFYPRATGNALEEASLYRRIFYDRIRSITGKAGSVFLADTFALHRGVRPTETERLVCWIRFGMRKNLAYTSDKFSPVDFDWNSNRIPNNDYGRFIGRLVLKPDGSSLTKVK